MSMNCDILFSYTNRREYVGVLNYRNTLSLQVQRVFDAEGSLPPTTASGVPPLLTGAYTGLIVNGVSFGTGRIVSFHNPVSTNITENGRHLWKQVVNMEMTTSGDASNVGAEATAGLLSIYDPQLVSMQEEFSFDLPAGGDYHYTHNVSVKCDDQPSGAGLSGYVIAANIASGLLASAPPFGYIDSVHSGMYTGAGRRLYSETIDIYNGTVNFQEEFSIQNRDLIRHNVTFENGYVAVTENGMVRNTTVSTADTIFGGGDLLNHYAELLAGANIRCNAIWTTYRDVLGTDAYEATLNAQPSQLVKTFDERSQEFSYAVIYTNNPNMTVSGYSIERQQLFTRNNQGVSEASEQGSLVSYSIKSSDVKAELLTAISGEALQSKDRLTAYYSGVSNYKQANESKSVSALGKKAGYAMVFTDDPSLINDGTYLTKTLSFQDDYAVRSHNPYLVLGKDFPIVHNPGQTQMGRATCAISATLPRPVGYYAANPSKPAALEQMLTDTINYLLQRIAGHTPLDTFVTRVNYSYGHDLTAEINVEAQYVYPRTTNI